MSTLMYAQPKKLGRNHALESILVFAILHLQTQPKPVKIKMYINEKRQKTSKLLLVAIMKLTVLFNNIIFF